MDKFLNNCFKIFIAVSDILFRFKAIWCCQPVSNTFKKHRKGNVSFLQINNRKVSGNT